MFVPKEAVRLFSRASRRGGPDSFPSQGQLLEGLKEIINALTAEEILPENNLGYSSKGAVEGYYPIGGSSHDGLKTLNGLGQRWTAEILVSSPQMSQKLEAPFIHLGELLL